MASNGVHNTAYDSTSCVVRWHLSKFPILSLEMPKTAVKREKLALLGEAYKTIRTPGVAEVAPFKATFTTVAWKLIVATLGDRYMEIEFTITADERIATVSGGYGLKLDRCQFQGHDPGKLEGGTEKARTVEMELDCVMVHERGEDGKWITAMRRPGEDPLASPAGRPLRF